MIKTNTTFLLFVSLFLSASINAQYEQLYNSDYGNTKPVFNINQRAAGDIIIQDNFSTGLSNWTASNSGAGAQGMWETGQVPGSVPQEMDDYMGYLQSGSPADGIAFFNGIQYLIAENVEDQDAFLTWSGSTIDLSSVDHVIIEFFDRYRPYYYDDIFLEVSDDGTNWTSYEINENLSQNGYSAENYQRINVTQVLANVPGAHVRFRWTETSSMGNDSLGSGYGWQIDDFQITESWENDLATLNVWPLFGTMNLDYHFIPESFLTAGGLTLAGKMQNKGSVSQTDVKFLADITFNSSNVFTGSSSTIPTFAAGQIDSTVISSSFTPANGFGTYKIEMRSEANETDSYSSNNLLVDQIEVTDIVYGRDDDSIRGTISNISPDSTGPFKIGNVFEMPVDGRSCKVYVGIGNNATPGQIFFVEIRKYNLSTQTYEYVTQSGDYVITQNDVGKVLQINFPQYDFTAGDTLLVLACHYGNLPGSMINGNVPFSYAQKVKKGSVLAYSSDFNLIELDNPFAILIRLYIDGICYNGLVEENEKQKTLKNYPNPLQSNTTIEYEILKPGTTQLMITDLSGKVVLLRDEGKQQPGLHRIELKNLNLAAGTYFYTIQTGEQRMTEKMVVMH